jgi:acetyltransferase-like isoleucine patch superfamily enzyme
MLSSIKQKIYRFLLLKGVPFLQGLQDRHKEYLLKSNPDIILGRNVQVNSDAKIETRYGGRIRIGENTEIHDGVLILSYGGEISIGSKCNINAYTIIYGHGNTFIGNNVLIAGQCMIIPNHHDYADRQRTILAQGCSAKGITIEDDVWIAHGCTILDGVTIEQGAVVGAGSVVTKSVPSYAVVAGVPARVIKRRS